jgi:hypothetical protein
MGWIGYQGSSNREADCAVWLYVGKNDKAKIIEEKLEASGMKPAPEDSNAFVIRHRAVGLKKDSKWFISTMQRIIDTV